MTHFVPSLLAVLGSQGIVVKYTIAIFFYTVNCNGNANVSDNGNANASASDNGNV